MIIKSKLTLSQIAILLRASIEVRNRTVLYWPDYDRLTVETCCHNVF